MLRSLQQPRKLSIRDVHLWVKAAIRSLTQDIASDSYHCAPSALARDPQLLAYWIMARPVRSSQLFIHDHDTFATLRIMIVETAASTQRNFHGVEIMWADDNIICRWHVTRWRIGIVLDRE